jgi:LysM repeat protein
VQPNQPVADVNAEVRQGANGIIFINDVKAIYVSNNMSLEQISGRHDVPLAKLKEYNENMASVRSDQPLNNGQVLFLQRKNRSFHGHTKFHIVKQGERMRDIAQKYGIRLYRLYTKNEMIEGTEPAIGERLILRRGWFEGWQTPQLRDASQESPVSPVAPPTAPTVPADVTNTSGSQPQGSGFPAAPPAPGGSTPSTPTYPTSTPVSTTTYTDGRVATTYSDGRIVTTHPDGRTTTTYPDNNNTTTYPSTTTPSTTTSTAATTPAPVVVKPAPVRPVKPAATPVKPSTSTTSAPKPPTAPTKPATAAAPVKPAAAPVKPAAAPVKPAAAPVKPTTTAPSTATASSTTSHHTVGQGETLYSISRKYGTTVDNIKKLNNLTSDGISVGLKLKVK